LKIDKKHQDIDYLIQIRDYKRSVLNRLKKKYLDYDTLLQQIEKLDQSLRRNDRSKVK